jgi:hypothetical protein
MPGPSSDRRILDLPELAVDRRNLLRSAALTAGLSLVGFCELRMTFINWLRISGAPVDVVAMLAGLSRPAFALSIDSKLLRKSIDRLPFVDLERVAELRQERMEHRPREAAPFCISGAELLTSRCVSHGAEATWLLWCSQHAESTARPRSGKAALRSTQTARLPRKGEETMRMGKAKTAADETVQEMLRAWFRRTFPVRLEGCSFFEARIEALIKGLPADLPIPKLTPMVIWNYTVTRRRQFGSTLQMIVDEVTILKVLVLGQRPSPDWNLPAHYVDVIGYLTAAPTTFSQAVR